MYKPPSQDLGKSSETTVKKAENRVGPHTRAISTPAPCLLTWRREQELSWDLRLKAQYQASLENLVSTGPGSSCLEASTWTVFESLAKWIAFIIFSWPLAGRQDSGHWGMRWHSQYKICFRAQFKVLWQDPAQGSYFQYIRMTHQLQIWDKPRVATHQPDLEPALC